MSKLITQVEFDAYAAAWATFLDQAARNPASVQQLFAPDGKAHQYQANVTFDIEPAVAQLVSTVGIAAVVAGFVLLPEADCPGQPRFRVVLYGLDGLGGRISAYHLGDATWYTKPRSHDDSPGDFAHFSQRAATTGPVPYNLIRGWILGWQQVALEGKLDAAMFATHYGPLQGYRFELSDFLNPLFTAGSFENKRLQVNLALKSYYPAYPDNPPRLAQTLGLVVRLYASDPSKGETDANDPLKVMMYDRLTGTGGGEGGGPSYDMGSSQPPY